MNIETFKSIFDEEYKKFLAQKEQETIIVDPVEDIKVPTFEEDPIGYILYTYPSLTESLVALLTDNFKDYITGIYIVSGNVDAKFLALASPSCSMLFDVDTPQPALALI